MSLFDNDTLVSTQNLRLGVLRVQEMMQHINVKRAQIEYLIDELATAQLATYKKLYLKDREIDNIIVIDDYLSPLAVNRMKQKQRQAVLSLEETEDLMQNLRNQSTDQIAVSMGITEERVPLVLISAVLTRRIAALMGAEYIWAPGVTLCDGIAYEYAEKIKMFREEHDFEKDIIACAINISKRYMGSRKRAQTLEEIAITIFDGMKKVHGLGKRQRLFLQLAAILHDCGKYISLTNVGENSYNIIMSTEIIGLSHKEREIVANIVRFNHSPFVYSEQGQIPDLDDNAYLTVAKLTAILRLASSLDRSHKQKLKGVKAQLVENELILQTDTLEDISLEDNFFRSVEDFFTEVFSVTPVLKQHKKF